MFGEPNMLIEDLLYFKTSANYSDKYSGIDSPTTCQSVKWFKNYPIQNFDYQFNSWGFRGPDYNQYIGKPVILCLGDSFTVNVGGPIEHSWPSLLQVNYDIPCLNLGMDGAGNDAIRLVYDRACKIFDVQKTFVVYSFLNRRLENKRFKSDLHEHQDNINYFEKHFIPNAYFNFIPHWCWTSEEMDYIFSKASYYLDTKEDFWDSKMPRGLVSKGCYQDMQGEDWCSYEEFIAGADPHPDVFTEEFGLKIIVFLLHNNRDGLHLSLEGNQKLADNLYNQTK